MLRPSAVSRVEELVERLDELPRLSDLVGAVGYYSLVSMTLNVAQVPLPAGVTPPLT